MCSDIVWMSLCFPIIFKWKIGKISLIFSIQLLFYLGFQIWHLSIQITTHFFSMILEIFFINSTCHFQHLLNVNALSKQQQKYLYFTQELWLPFYLPVLVEKNYSEIKLEYLQLRTHWVLTNQHTAMVCSHKIHFNGLFLNFTALCFFLISFLHLTSIK